MLSKKSPFIVLILISFIFSALESSDYFEFDEKRNEEWTENLLLSFNEKVKKIVEKTESQELNSSQRHKYICVVCDEDFNSDSIPSYKKRRDATCSKTCIERCMAESDNK